MHDLGPEPVQWPVHESWQGLHSSLSASRYDSKKVGAHASHVGPV
jgi:hypothetical protein